MICNVERVDGVENCIIFLEVSTSQQRLVVGNRFYFNIFLELITDISKNVKKSCS